MICPVEIARDMSAFRAARVGDDAKHGFLPEGRSGAGDESTGRDVAGHGEEDYVVASGGDSRHQRPAHAALAGTLRTRGVQRVDGPAAGEAFAAAGAGGEGGEGAGALPGALSRFQRAAFSREAGSRAWHRTELHVGEASAAGSGVGGAGAQARGAPQATSAAALAGDVVAYRRQPSSVVAGRALVR